MGVCLIVQKIWYNGLKVVYSINGVGKLDRYMQKNEIRLSSYTTHKNKFKMD